MPRLDRLPQVNRNNLLTFPAQVNDRAPFVRSASRSRPAGWRSSPRPACTGAATGRSGPASRAIA